ncbi:MAG: polysaccharide biosynthesis C-terminal domain-containing protein [Candidatus Hodarchaeales archaeon]|jgi:dTDP-4-dehydrorhamnose 3,5-epimerase
MITKIIDLQLIPTKNKNKKRNGTYIPIYKSLEEKIKGPVTQVYMTSCYPGETKGPHLHNRRRGHLTVLKGKVSFVLEHKLIYGDTLREEIVISAEEPKMIVVPEGTPNAHTNIGSEEAIVLNICTRHCWSPEDTDDYSVEFK